MKPMLHNWTLTQLRDGKPGHFWSVAEGSVTAGRAPANAIQLPDISVSRQHAEFLCDQNGISVRDLKSRNGILVNGVPRQRAELQAGDLIRIGIFEFQLTCAPPTEGESIKTPPLAGTQVEVYPTGEQGVLLPNERRTRELSTLYHVCFWIAEGVSEKDFVPKCLRLLLDAFRVEEVHLYSAAGRLETWATASGKNPSVKLASFLARRFQESSETSIMSGASIAQHQKGIARFNYLVGPLRAQGAGPKETPFVVLLRPVEWQEFDSQDRVLLQAIAQQWVLGQSRAVQWQNLRHENVRLKERLRTPALLGQSDAMEKLREHARRAASTNVTVLLQGETGSGKEVVAQFIHDQSARNGRAFVKFNCAAVPEGLIESELFGHVEGAFTGAGTTRLGKFVQADEGTLFFDEIGEMPPSAQAKVLRAIENGEIEALGSETVTRVNVRFIAATHRDLGAMVQARSFREDLFYRLNVMTVQVPPLREHLEDVETLANFFLEQFVAENGMAEMDFTPEAVRELQRHSWPGNVRELRNVIQRCAVMVTPPVIGAAEVLQQIQGADR